MSCKRKKGKKTSKVDGSKKIKEIHEIKKINKLNNFLKSADIENTLLSSSSSGEDSINEDVIDNIIGKVHKNINNEDKFINKIEEITLNKKSKKHKK
jgi:hypothetical protein